jgi:PAS domain S-box-containing protein
MREAKQGLAEQYISSLMSYVENPQEGLLQKAHDLGRTALADGLGVLELTVLHHQALTAALLTLPQSANALETMGVAEKFFIESLTPLEMSLRGYKEANEALRRSEERYRELFENANDIVFTTDLEGKFTSVNRACERLSGYSREESANLRINDIVAPDFQEMGRRMLQRKLAGEEATTYELQIITKDGQRIPLEVNTRLVLHEGKPVGVQGIGRDVTERKRAEEALLLLNQRLEEEAKRIAHELHDEASQLLASVHIALDETAREASPSGMKSISNVKGLLDQIEDQLRRLSHELRPTILDDLGLVPALEFLAEGVSKRSHVRIAVEGSTGGRLEPEMESALYRVVQEALNNATRHAEAKDVKVRLWREDKKILCLVSDDGMGFDVRAVAIQKGRRGLGLIGMRERLAAVRGTCTINSNPGHGTEVLASIPEGS